MRTRYDHFQIMRGIACLMVFLNHVSDVFTSRLDLSGHWYAALLTPAGFPWVWLFFILSGFLLTKQFVEGRSELSADGVWNFYKRRSRRLLPMLWFAPLLFAVLYELHVFAPSYPAFHYKQEIWVALAMPWLPYLESGNPVGSFNSPVWSAVLEVHFFLLLPIYLWATGFSKKAALACVGIWLLGIVALAVHVAIYGSPTIFPMIYQQHFYNAGFMMAGSALAILKLKPLRISLAWPIAVCAAVLVGNQYSTLGINLSLAIMPIVMLPAFAFLVLQCNSHYQAALPQSIRELRLGAGPLRWIELAGMMSYSIYLLHKPIALAAIYQLDLEARVTGLLSMGAMTLITIAVISPIIICAFVFVECRFRHGRLAVRQPMPGGYRSNWLPPRSRHDAVHVPDRL